MSALVGEDLGFESQLCPVVVMWSWASSLAFLCLSFLLWGAVVTALGAPSVLGALGCLPG